MHSELDRVRLTLQQNWGYSDFRFPQGEIIQSLLARRDALIIMPTGGGKSLCFQLPALLQEGLTLVISPLIALMENQVKDLQQKKLPAALLHGELSAIQKKEILQAIVAQQLRLLYLSPETLFTEPIWQRIKASPVVINGLVLDEAHCLVYWGDNFRPAYRRLGAVRSALLKSKPPGTKMPIAAFTATADPQARQEILTSLQLENPEIFLISPYRPNLDLNIVTVWTPKCRRDRLINFIGARPQQTGIVYVRSRRDSEVLASRLQLSGYSTAPYHAGLAVIRKRAIESDWLSEKIQFVVATNAFGMGIDKANVRWLVQFQPPQLLAEYIQEVGRGGRDCQKASILTLVSEPTGWLDPLDRQMQNFFTANLEQNYRRAISLIREIPREGNIVSAIANSRDREIALSLLNSLGRLKWLDPFHYQIGTLPLSSFKSQLLQQQKLARQLMNRYLYTKNCRWQFLLNAFGFGQNERIFRCGHCDRCRNRGNF
jgi:ATP-dependent DNA helicase RecQ